MANELELNADPESTWGATPEYKEAWHAKYGNPENVTSVEEDNNPAPTGEVVTPTPDSSAPNVVATPTVTGRVK